MLILLIVGSCLFDIVPHYSLDTINDNQYVYKTIVSIIERSRTIPQGKVHSDIDGVVVDGSGRIYRLSEQVVVTLGEPYVEAINSCIGAIHT